MKRQGLTKYQEIESMHVVMDLSLFPYFSSGDAYGGSFVDSKAY